MDEEVLSKQEVESLLSSADVAKKAAAEAGEELATPVSPVDTTPLQRVAAYDFKRPERIGKEQMRALQSLHEGFGRNFGAAMSAMLRSIVEVKLTSVDQLTYSEFVFSLENPTCFNLIKAEPLDGSFILDINPSILYPFIDRLLGGGKDTGPPARRPLTEIELRLVSRITSLFLDELKRAWANVVELDLAVDRVESNPHLVQIVPPNEVVVLISFEITLGETRGMMNLCIPFNSIERISNKLTSNSWIQFAKTAPTAESMAQIGRRLDRSLVELVVTLADSTISTGDLLALRVGDIITTEKDVKQPLDVAVEGVPKYFAQPGAFKGHKAIQVSELIQSRPADPPT